MLHLKRYLTDRQDFKIRNRQRTGREKCGLLIFGMIHKIFKYIRLIEIYKLSIHFLKV